VSEIQGNTLFHISFFSFARYLSESLFFVRGFLLAKLFGPSLFGIWTQCKLALLFLQYVQLGTLDGMKREVPLAIGKGDSKRVDTIKSAVFGFVLLFSVGIAITIIIISAFSGRTLKPAFKSIWIYFAGIFLVSQVYWFIHVRLQSEKRFIHIGKMVFGFALSSTALCLLLSGISTRLLSCSFSARRNWASTRFNHTLQT